MGFLLPAGLALAALAIPIVALYFLKLRRDEKTVSSLYLWRTLVRDTAANAPWQRLRPSWLLFLQLLALALLVLGVARPFSIRPAAPGDHLILVLDTSASMGATDEQPTRLAAALREASRLVSELAPSSRVTLITAGADTRVLLSAATDRAAIAAALDGVRDAGGASDISAALNLAAAVAARERDPEIVLLSDGKATLPERTSLPARVRYVPFGDPSTGNSALLALSLRSTAAGQAYSAFVQAVHYGPAAVERRLTLTSDGQVVAARTLTLPPGEPQAAIFDDLPATLPYVEARLEGSDALAADDRAWAAPPAPSSFRIDLVTEGNRFLQAALSLLPGAEVTAVRPADYAVAECQPGQPCRRAELTVFDAAPLPEGLPPGALLVIAPPQATRLFSVTGGLDAPFLAPARADESLLRYVDLRQVQLRSAAAVPLPTWARPVVVAPGTSCPLEGVDAPCPLLFAGQAEGRRIGVMAFDLRQSDLPLRPAFPVLLANLLDFFRGPAAGGVPATVRPGEAVTLALPPGAGNPAVLLPDGQRVPVREGTEAAPFDRTALPGLYTLEYDGAAGRVRQQFAVNLFDARESDLAPANSLPLIGLRRGAAGETPSGRQEWWRPLAALALAVLLVEWLVAHRSDWLRLRHALFVRSAPGRR